PFPIGAGRTQGIWIDVYIPPDAPAGSYTGTVQVLQNSSVTHQVPVTLQVYDFTLPDTTHFHTMFAHGGAIERHGATAGSPHWWSLYQKYMHVFHRHRVNFNQGNKTPAQFEAYMKGFYTGTAYTSGYGYDGPGTGVGNNAYGIGVYDQPDRGFDSGFWPNTREAWQAAADAWETWFQANAPTVSRYKYMTDEPEASEYAVIAERVGWIRSSAGPGKNLKTYCTVKMDSRLFGMIDYWALTGQSGYDPGDGQRVGYIGSIARSRQALGEQIAFYNGTRPGYGVPELLDNVLADNRVNPWIAFKYNVNQYFLWQIGEALQATPPKNTWVSCYMDWGSQTVKNWGEGTYVYAGEDAVFPSDSRGVTGPIVSMRMKNFRRGMQDYEYLWLARQAGVPEDSIMAILNSVVPAALDEVTQTAQPQYAERGYPYEHARRRLAELLSGSAHDVNSPTGSLRITPTTVPAGGGSVTIEWNSQNAERAFLDNGVGEVSLSGSTEVYVAESRVFRLVLQNGQAQRTIAASVVVTPAAMPAGPNLVPNPGFENGTTSWLFHTDGTGSFTNAAPGFFDGQAGKIEITGTGANVQLYQTNIPLKPGSVYRLSFQAKSSTAHDVQVSLFQHDAPYAEYGVSRRQFDLGPTWRKFSFEFLPQNINTAVSDARLQFWLGSHAVAGDVYSFDDVTLQEVGATFSPELPPPAGFVSPAPGSYDSPSHVRLTWRLIEGAESYHVQISTTEQFSSLIVDEVVADTALDVGPLQGSTTYYRRVLSRGPRGESAFCQVCSFGTTSFKTSVNGTGVGENGFVLHQNYPNPFNPTTVIRYNLPRSSDVSLRVYNALGQEVLTLVQGNQAAGSHEAIVDASGLPTGLYFYRLAALGLLETKKMVVVR
ncbi:MAG: carbohydrate binding domain-containing protein, partial [Bacteroidetes bacterium]|nr:carbohydrate binding domain-containing protein [Bacteroidota bacterium]